MTESKLTVLIVAPYEKLCVGLRIGVGSMTSVQSTALRLGCTGDLSLVGDVDLWECLMDQRGWPVGFQAGHLPWR